ncbi:hypothetical protein HFV04_012655 [Pseudomonas sp. BIGb0427]|uniref:Uncharacterized protein n=1 Tax=Pseudomonas vranovensis TaxID=321661 RepID=A0A423DSC1_9PSED|nr:MULTISPECIES: hypothetical protein [Pseudomonas]KJK20428.1 hypothetical protein UB48_01430 [Pseudomonas sp. 2(2015)]QPG65582.1 hypothetical protein HFV04_012655 [Pseudomonas sp. BIGb0427]ROL74638.1 hypothetical protein BHU25_10515 [Pseudomonas vranovensis]UVM68030.1 hypothetical protein LOY34_05710 [Pseudomonas sp. B21-009]
MLVKQQVALGATCAASGHSAWVFPTFERLCGLRALCILSSLLIEITIITQISGLALRGKPTDLLTKK